MFWADRIAQEIIKSKKHKPYWVDDMKTPSGRIHVGSLRGVLIHELIFRALKNAGKDVTFTYVFEDHDPMDELPFYLDKNKWSKFLGEPLFMIPSPDKKAENFARYFAQEFRSVFEKLGCSPEIIWVSDLYKRGLMNDYIKLCLDKASTIRGIYEKLYKKKIAHDWYPFQVVCPNCGKETTTKVTGWDGKMVTFCCTSDAVVYTKGCGICGKISPFSDKKRYSGKLPWKVEWGVKWKVIGVTIEGAGKDHMSAGGSHDVAKLVCQKILKYPVPYPIAYEFFLIGGRKMSSSKGLGKSAKEVSEIVPPYLGRFLFTRTDYREAIEFDPVGTMAIPDLFDEYDRCWRAYNTDSDKDSSRIFELSQIGRLPTQNPKLFLPRFRDIANYIQHPSVDLEQKFSEIKGTKLISDELEVLRERQNYAKIWLADYAPQEYKIVIKKETPPEAKNLTSSQKKYLKELIKILGKAKGNLVLEKKLYEIAKSSGISTKDAFAAIYFPLLGKTSGPKAAPFLLSLDVKFVLKRFKEVIS